MANTAQIIGIITILAVIGASAYGMFAFFGPVGVALLGGFLLPIFAILAYVGDFDVGGKSSSSSSRTYESKGAQSDE